MYKYGAWRKFSMLHRTRATASAAAEAATTTIVVYSGNSNNSKSNLLLVCALAVYRIYIICVVCLPKTTLFKQIFLARIKNYIKLKIEYKRIIIILVTPVWPIHAKCLICSSVKFPNSFLRIYMYTYIHLCTAAWMPQCNNKKPFDFIRFFADKSILIGIQGLFLTFMFASDWHPFWQTHSYQMHFH